MIRITFLSHDRKAQCAPNPDFPNGIDIDLAGDAPAYCKAKLPYPADCCGVLIARCSICGESVAITTAGRPDDPRSVKFACKAKAPAQ